MHNSDTTQTESTSDRPSWLVYFEERIEEERDELFSEAQYYEIIRDLLLAPSDDDKAVDEAITKFYDLYAAQVRNEKKDPPEYGAGHKLNAISIVAFEAAVKVWYTSPEHQKLADFLIGIKKGAREEFDEEVSTLALIRIIQYLTSLIESPICLYWLGARSCCTRAVERWLRYVTLCHSFVSLPTS